MKKALLYFLLPLGFGAAIPWVFPGEEDPTWKDSLYYVGVFVVFWTLGFFSGRGTKSSKKG